MLSWALTVLPGLPWRGKTAVGVPVKDYIAQSGIFALCALGLLGQATELWRTHRVRDALLLVAAAALFAANVLYVATGRTTLVVMAILLVVLAFRRFGGKGSIVVCVLGGVLAGVVWTSSPYLRVRVTYLIDEIVQYRERGEQTSAGQRLEFWRKSASDPAALRWARLTDPDAVPSFLAETRADLLAVSIGNVHGSTPVPPTLDLDRLAAIARAT